MAFNRNQNILSRNYFTKKKLLTYLIVGFPLLILLTCAIWISYHQDKRTVQNGVYKIPSEHISYFEDPTNSLTVEQIVTEHRTFDSLPDGIPNFGFNPNTIWLKFYIHSGMEQANKRLLEIKNPLLNEVSLFEIKDNQIVALAQSGDNHAFSSRPVSHRNYVFPIDLAEETVKHYYLKLNSGGEQLLAPIALYTPQSMTVKDGEDQLIRGSYFGIVLFVLFFNLFIYFIIKERSTLYYVYYNFFLLLLQLSLGGYGFQYIWPGSPYLANAATPLFATLSIFALMRFSQSFLELAKFFPKIDRIFSYVSYGMLINVVFSLSGNETLTFISILFINAIALLLNIAIIPTAIAVIKKDFKPAKIFLAGFILLIVTVFGFVSTNLGIIQNDFYADYGLIIGSTAEVILLSLAIVDRFKLFKDQALNTLKEMNEMQRIQNQVLEQKVEERTLEIQLQKTEIEEKNEEILSSIRYAKRIQSNVLPSTHEISQLFNEHFVLYMPKDIVSGDFYWIGKTKLNGIKSPPHEVLLFATGDCTGHGVPGAMVSVMSCNLLRETLLQFPEVPPHEMLEALDRRLQDNMNGSDREHGADGMDLALWALQTDTMQLRFAGANNGISIWRNGDWIEMPGTKRPIGMRDIYGKKPFEANSINLLKGDIIYSWTDGVTDQFGGVKGKKLKTSGLKEMLGSIAQMTLEEQKQRIQSFIEKWKEGTEQTDDICITAVRV